MRTVKNEVIIKLDLSGMAEGQKGGLSHFGSPNYSAVGVVCNGAIISLEMNVKGVATSGPVLTNKNIWLKTTWSLDGLSQYSCSTDGTNYTPVGDPYQMMWGSYRGDRLAIYNYNNKAEEGYVDVDFFRYDFKKSR